MSIKEILYYSKFDLRTLNSGGARFMHGDLEAKVRKARKLAKKLG